MHLRRLALIVSCLSLLVLLAGHAHPARAGSPSLPPQQPTLSLSPGMLTITVSLMAGEHSLPPLGIPPNPQRDLGFATVFLRLENQRAIPQTLTLEAIEIRSKPEEHLEPFAFQPRTIELKPLEHAVIDIHLSQPTGYRAKERVQAVVRYRLGDQPAATVASEAVAIERR